MAKYPWSPATETNEPYENLVAFDDWIEKRIAPCLHYDWDEVGASLRAELYLVFCQVFDNAADAAGATR